MNTEVVNGKKRNFLKCLRFGLVNVFSKNPCLHQFLAPSELFFLEVGPE